MKENKWLCGLFAILMCFLVSCQSAEDEIGTKNSSDVKVIGVSLPTTQLVYREAMKELVDQTYGNGAVPGIEIRIYDANGSLEQQSQHILEMVDDQVDGIILIPGSTEQCLPAVEYANSKHVPVITVDNRIFESSAAQVISFVGADHYDMGKKAVKLFLELLEENFSEQETWNIIQLSGIPEASGTIDRGQAISETLAGNRRINLLGSYDGEFSVENARSVMEDCLNIFPKIDGVICQNDNMAEGCYQALEKAGLAGKIVVVGIDGQSTTLSLIKQGGIHGTVLQQPSMILDGIDLLCRYLDGETLEKNYYSQTYPITQQNAGYHLDNGLSW